MTGMRNISLIRIFEERVKKFGFRITSANDPERLTIKPSDENWPVYVRDTALFVGTMEEADAWMDGVMWAKDYFRMIGISNEKKIQKQEDLIRQQATLEKLQGR